MPEQKSDRKETPNAPRAPRGTALNAYLSGITTDVENLEQKVQSLPRVDEKGKSECPFAEDLYAQKEALEAKLTAAAPELRAYQVALEAEVARCEKNMAKIRGGAGRVATAGVVKALDSAAQAAEDALYQAKTDRDAIALVRPRVEAVLEISRTRKYPGKEPRRRELFPVPGGQAPPAPGAALGRELEGAFSLGPLSRKR